MLVSAFLDLLIKSIKGHTGFHETGMIDWVDVEDLVHATTEINDHRSSNARRGTAVSDCIQTQ
jgi:hypothetical protein